LGVTPRLFAQFPTRWASLTCLATATASPATAAPTASPSTFCLLGRPLSTSAPAATPTAAALCLLPRPRLLALGTGLGTFADGLPAFASGLRAFTERLRLSGARSPTRRRALGSFGRACPLRGRLGRPRPASPSPFSDFTRWCCPAFPTRAACASR